MSLIWSLIGFVITISILVTIHELGHFAVARALGVRVLRFSVGFGKPLWLHKAKDGTEYAVSSLPLGGYVRMLDEREGDVPPEEREQAFNRQPVWSRMLIVLAGPVSNLVLAVLLYAGMYLVGVPGIRPYVGSVIHGSVAQRAGFARGDLLVRVDGRPVESWQQARMALLNLGLAGSPVSVTVREKNGTQRTLTVTTDRLKLLKNNERVLQSFGLRIWRPSNTLIAKALPGGPAARAGLRKNDEIIAVNGQKLDSVEDFLRIVQSHPDQSLHLEVRRHGRIAAVSVIPKKVVRDGRTIGLIDAEITGKVPAAVQRQLMVLVHYPPLAALTQGGQKTWQMIAVTARVLMRLVVGQASIHDLSGPITIAEYAGMTLTMGMAAFLGFMAVVSVSLGVLNLLPVPLLDGGQFLFLFIEGWRRKPLSESAQLLGQKIGVLILGALMALAIYNDLYRLFK